jgi:integrase
MLAELGDDWLFSLNGRCPIGGVQRRKVVIEAASGVKDWCLHDLRRTARTLLSRAGVTADIAERALGHVIGGVRGRYDRYAYRAEKAAAFEALASLVSDIVGPNEAKPSLSK